MNHTKKTSAESCRDAVRLAQKQLARATASAAKAELPLERKLHALSGELYGMADLLEKAMAPMREPEAMVNPVEFAPLPLRTLEEVIKDIEDNRQRVAESTGIPSNDLSSYINMSISKEEERGTTNDQTA